MVLSGFGCEISEAELRARCDCTFDGTSALKAIDAARELGLTGTAKHTLSFDELKRVVADGLFPIVFVDLAPIDGVRQAHAFVVVEAGDFSVSVLDPTSGERRLPRQVFDVAWGSRHYLAIIVEE
jgi:ABC-type bacteriocin/lantibiotic exporter with double-glycine peptidase domain